MACVMPLNHGAKKMEHHIIYCGGGELTSLQLMTVQERLLSEHSFSDFYKNNKGVKYTKVKVDAVHDSRDYKAFSSQIEFKTYGGFSQSYLFKNIPTSLMDGESIQERCEIDAGETPFVIFPNKSVHDAILEVYAEVELLGYVSKKDEDNDEAIKKQALEATMNIAMSPRFIDSLYGHYNNKKSTEEARAALEGIFGVDFNNCVNLGSFVTSKSLRRDQYDDIDGGQIPDSVTNLLAVYKDETDKISHKIYTREKGLVFDGYIDTQFKASVVAEMVGLIPVW